MVLRRVAKHWSRARLTRAAVVVREADGPAADGKLGQHVDNEQGVLEPAKQEAAPAALAQHDEPESEEADGADECKERDARVCGYLQERAQEKGAVGQIRAGHARTHARLREVAR